MYSKTSKLIIRAVCHLGGTVLFALTPMAHAVEWSEQDFVQQLRAVDGAPDKNFRDLRMPDHNGLCAGPKEMGPGNSKDLEIVEAPPPGAPRVRLTLQFADNSYVLSKSDKEMLGKLARALRHPDLKDASFTLAGHTSSSGDAVANQKLSCGRSIAVRDYLIAQRIAAKRLSAYGFGKSQPLASGDAASAENRRVEIIRAESN